MRLRLVVACVKNPVEDEGGQIIIDEFYPVDAEIAHEGVNEKDNGKEDLGGKRVCAPAPKEEEDQNQECPENIIGPEYDVVVVRECFVFIMVVCRDSVIGDVHLLILRDLGLEERILILRFADQIGEICNVGNFGDCSISSRIHIVERQIGRRQIVFEWFFLKTSIILPIVLGARDVGEKEGLVLVQNIV